MSLKIIKIAVAAVLLIALASLPIGYYTFLRIVVCIAGVILGVAYFESKRLLSIVFVAVAILFNPILPIYLSREIWIPIDIITAILFIISIFLPSEKGNDEPKI